MTHIRFRLTTLTAAVLLFPFGTALAGAAPEAGGESCPAVYALGVQGTGESSPDAAPTTDTGMLSQVFTPLTAAAQAAAVNIAHEYIPYNASFGGLGPSSGTVPYEQSVTGGVDSLTSKISQIASSCAATVIALTGYSQGAHVVSKVAQAIGAGSGPIAANRVAGVALFGDPTRNSGSSTFPGSDRSLPDPVPGTSGEAVKALDAVTASAASGGGIGPQRDIAVSYGDLTGRVASFCSSGDLACDAPDDAALLRTVANVAGQVEIGNDPLKSLASITQALALTSIKTATSVVNNNISGDSLANLQFNSKKSISSTLAEASDPDTQVDISGALKALLKVGTIAINAISTVVKTVVTPSNIAEIATAGLANPVAGLAVFGSKLVGALPQLIPPATASKMIQSAFTEVVNNIDDNKDLLDVATWTKYSDVILRHGSYQHDSVSGGGKSAVNWVADWFAAAARDVAGVVGASAPGSLATTPAATPSAVATAPATAPSAPQTSGTTPYQLDFGSTSAPSSADPH